MVNTNTMNLTYTPPTFLDYLADERISDKASAYMGNKASQLVESSISYPVSETLSPDIWNYTDGVYTLKPELSKAFLKMCMNVMRYFNLYDKIIAIRIIGSICSNLYQPPEKFDDPTDIDIHIVTKTELIPQETLDKMNKVLRDEKYRNRIFGKTEEYFNVTKYPLEFYIQGNKYQDYGSVGCYNLLTNEWVEGPEIYPIDYDPYVEFDGEMDRIKYYAEKITLAIEELRRDLIDLKFLIQSDNSKKDLSRKIAEKEIEVLSQLGEIKRIKAEAVNIRKTSNNTQPKSKEEANELKKSTDWQANNAVFKFLNRYGYFKKCQDIEKEYNEIMDSDNTTHVGIYNRLPRTRQLLKI